MTPSFAITEPPLVHIEPLPKGTSVVRLSRQEDMIRRPLLIEAFLEGDCGYMEAEGKDDDADGNAEESFRDEYCRSCSFYFETERLSNLSDPEITIELDGEELELATPERDIIVNSPCPCYADGVDYVSWPCHAGFRFNPDDYDRGGGSRDVDLNHMRYGVLLNADNPDLLDRYSASHSSFTAAIQRLKRFSDEHGQSVIHAAPAQRVLNIYDNFQICWGYGNDAPSSLAESEHAYRTLGANEDLLSIESHEYNVSRCFSDEDYKPLSGTLFEIGDPGSEHALILAPLTPELRQSFLLLATAPGAQLTDGFAALVARRALVQLPGSTTPQALWVSDDLPDGSRWLIASRPDDGDLGGVLLGQLPIPHLTPVPA